MKISPRVHYGTGFYQSAMTYQIPDITGSLEAAKTELHQDFPWVPWNKIDLQPYHTEKERALRKHGQFFGRAGLNLPLVFVDVEGGVGMFSESHITAEDATPLGKLFSEEKLKEIVIRQMTNPRPKGALTVRTGLELQRILPDQWLPRVRFGPFAAGLDGAGYFIFGTDMSYKTGVEIIDPAAREHLEELFDPIPLIPAKIKTEAANAIVTQVEAKIPTYFWPPALKGYGLSGKAYLDIGKSLRLSATYQYESLRGISFSGEEWLGEGPQVIRTFYSFGIESQL